MSRCQMDQLAKTVINIVHNFATPNIRVMENRVTEISEMTCNMVNPTGYNELMFLEDMFGPMVTKVTVVRDKSDGGFIRTCGYHLYPENTHGCASRFYLHV